MDYNKIFDKDSEHMTKSSDKFERIFSESTKSNKELMNEEYLPYDGAVYRAGQMYKALERQFGHNVAKSAFQTVADKL